MTNLATRAAQVRDSTVTNSNTAALVGGVLYDLARATPFNVEAYGASTTGTGAANDTAIAAALVDAIAAGGYLFWPALYPSAASIANLHTVRHRGPGGITRGSNNFYVDPTRSQTNDLYCAATGTAGNDGLTSAQPTTLVTTASYLANYGPMLDGTWRVNLAAGTHSPGAQTTVDGLQSRNPIQFLGPAVAYAAPTAIIDGTGTVGGICGLYFRNQVRATVRDIKVQNFASTDACGVIADRFCELTCDNVHSAGNDLAGVDVEASTRLYLTGGTHALNNYYNVRAYGQCLVSVGYNGSGHRTAIGDALHAGGSGVLLRDNSSGHVDYCDINGVHDGGGVELINNSRVHLVSCVFGGSAANYYNLKLGSSCEYIDDTCTFNAATAKSIVQWGFSIDSASSQLFYFDKATGFFKFGRTDSLTPKCLLDVQDTATALWGGSYNSNVLFGVDGSANAYIGLGAANNGESGIMFADVAGNRQGQFSYLHTSDSLLLRVNAIDAFRWFADGAAGAYYRPEVTGANAPALGDATHGWRALFLGAAPVKVSSGTGSPAGVVTGSPGDIWLRTDGGAGTTLYVKESGAATTAGWVGK